jgi:hypothetical protein
VLTVRMIRQVSAVFVLLSKYDIVTAIISVLRRSRRWGSRKW